MVKLLPISEEQLKAFHAKVQADASLQEQLKVEGTDVVAAAKAAGFSITTEDLNTELLDQELSTYALQSIAGGKSYNYHCTVRTKDGATKVDCNFPNHNH